MPGSSLWLLPPASHPLTSKFTSLIASTSAHFSSPHLFLPHITLTIDIPPTSHSDPQAFLNSFEFPNAQDVIVKLEHLQSEPVFFKKLYINVAKLGIKELARVARSAVDGFEEEGKAREWVEEDYKPHLSLL